VHCKFYDGEIGESFNLYVQIIGYCCLKKLYNRMLESAV